FLSVQDIDRVVYQLLEGGYPIDTPVVVIYKATWPDQELVRGSLEDIADKVKAAGIKKTALILVGRFLGNEYNYSKLYDKYFSHEYRDSI
ncbi:MAG: cobalt-precorrin-4 C(11)-methyltransferase, partial [Peptostreptococcus sp.]|nr:cobalt-precorrin-4 C(11)-methyltransferase [Peptostreptococcus sp.]